MAMNRRSDLDFLKGFAIVSVILYHMYILKSGYLGVDLFFVISGYLFLPRLIDTFSQRELDFSFFSYIIKRLSRLWPLVVIATAVCLLIGWWGMLPDDFENLAENVVAANLLSTNLLSSITIKDYWAVRTSYQPLMHLWYLGILFEYYLVVPILLYIIRWTSRKLNLNVRKTLITTLCVLSAISLVIYLLPSVSDGARFYLLPSRFYELTAGGLVGLLCAPKADSQPTLKWGYYVSLVLLCVVICISIFSMQWGSIGLEEIPVGSTVKIAPSNIFILSRPVCLLLTVILSTIVVYLGSVYGTGVHNRFLGHLGKMSLSLFIWHQIMLAFYRYYVTDQLSWPFVIAFFVILYLLSYITYQLVERKFKSDKALAGVLVGAVVISALAGWVYRHAGVVRDVPELNTYYDSAQRGQHKKYTDRIYKLSKPFPDNGKINVLLKGNSFARDFGSVLMESPYKDKINIYLIRDFEGVKEETIRKSDYAFIFSDKGDVPDLVWNNIDAKKVYGIGTKTFGDSNGIIYKNRHDADYFQQTIQPRKEYLALNEQWANSWGDHYFNFMEMSMDDQGAVRVFTPDHMYISQDCRHLTQAGAKYFASLIDFDRVFRE